MILTCSGRGGLNRRLRLPPHPTKNSRNHIPPTDIAASTTNPTTKFTGRLKPLSVSITGSLPPIPPGPTSRLIQPPCSPVPSK